MTTRWLAPICCLSLLLLGGLKGRELGFRAQAQDRPAEAGALAPSQPQLGLGTQGAEVRQLQLQLTELGLYSGAADGLYGMDTAQAVRSLQQQQGLVADGIAGDQTWLALDTLQRSAVLTLPPPLLMPELFAFTPLTVAQPAPPPSALWLALMPLVPITGGTLTYLQRRFQRRQQMLKRRAQRKPTLPR